MGPNRFELIRNHNFLTNFHCIPKNFKSFTFKLILMIDPKLREDLTKKADHYFNKDDYNCAEALGEVIFGDYFNIPLDRQIVTALGGGIAGTGGLCGGVVVGCMGISKKYGRKTPDQTNSIANYAVRRFLTRVRQEYGCLNCAGIREQNESKAKESQPNSENVGKKPCTPLIIKIVDEFLYSVEGLKHPRV